MRARMDTLIQGRYYCRACDESATVIAVEGAEIRCPHCEQLATKTDGYDQRLCRKCWSTLRDDRCVNVKCR